MPESLNAVQSQELARFFFDVAKGLTLGGIGFTTIAPLETKVIVAVLTLTLVYWSIRAGLTLLQEKI